MSKKKFPMIRLQGDLVISLGDAIPSGGGHHFCPACGQKFKIKEVSDG